ncbi:Haloacid dehalogenase [Lasiodiplodia theobromae]|uniref:(S)-2-haloacid dehalogenase n=1 Tax=Lasiodiplodia theobromae TaxID=45133 RepID=A0A5N5DF20_9PEZI|nr:Haloacid dehalogenase [Lasiodiplodia theobromae]KAB2576335.1 (S)-2-haloacid dehalogenase [Lasiodiplodia theobromae]KAF4533894.1 Haloacid dehalogenase [Lasiodiplodia theobromae]
MPGKVIVAFDAYGTLLSTESIAKQLAEHFGQDKAQTIAATWRKYQLEYTWRLNSMNQYEPFSAVTQRSLKHALAESNVSLSQGDIDGLMKAYDSLSIFPDIAPCLTALKSKASITAVVFSNGTQSMVSNSVNHSPDLAPHASVFSDIVVVEPIKKYKPAPEVYMHLAESVDKKATEMGDMWLVSGNPFDVVGARAVGMKAAWVDRAGKGWQDALVTGPQGEPTVVLKSLEELPAILEKYAEA